jgi:succinate dehydrogenase / fumarate reductase flavoprotein subunit
MTTIARVIATGARNRDESRGAHYKPAFKTRDDENWQRTTLAFHAEQGNGRSEVKFVREFDYTVAATSLHATDKVDISLVAPRARKYETAGAASAAATGNLEDKKKDAQAHA